MTTEKRKLIEDRAKLNSIIKSIEEFNKLIMQFRKDWEFWTKGGRFKECESCKRIKGVKE